MQKRIKHMEMKISKPIFGILVALTKNTLTKICNEPGNRYKEAYFRDLLKRGLDPKCFSINFKSQILKPAYVSPSRPNLLF